MGMNTNDIRNMRVNQWVFWAVAVPLASIVITLCLVWAGELANFRRGVAGLWRGGKGWGGGGTGAAWDVGETDYARARRLGAGMASWEAPGEGFEMQEKRVRSDLYGNRRYGQALTVV